MQCWPRLQFFGHLLYGERAYSAMRDIERRRIGFRRAILVLGRY